MSSYKIGGFEPLGRVPAFKYTFNEPRKLFVGVLYPYAEYFINSIVQIPFGEYTYSGETEILKVTYKDYRYIKSEQIETHTSISPPLYYFSGGAAYELLHKRYTNVYLHNYCDATGDIDVTLYPPRFKFKSGSIYFLAMNGTITDFFRDFTEWTFQQLYRNIEQIHTLFNNIESIKSFNINEYEDIPIAHQTADLGYQVLQLGKFFIVGFLDESTTMYKIQVC